MNLSTTDHLGSVREVRNLATGLTVAAFDYTPYGAIRAQSGSLTPDYGFAGLWRSSSGLYLTHYRAYSPTYGRWITRDPIEEAGGVNLYAYVGGKPTFYIDPSGLLDRLVYDGTHLTGYEDFGIEFQVPAMSGPWGKGPLPDGVYNGNNLRIRKDNKAMMCPDGSSWSLNLDPMFKTSRTLLRIHPDGNIPGTEGCIGPSCKGQQRVYDALRNYFGDELGATSIPVIVRYPK